MPTVPTQIRIEKSVKDEAVKLFNQLGLDMSSAVNMFLRQCVLREGLPFSVEMPQYNKKTLAAIEEARRMSDDPNAIRYTNLDDLFEALEE